MAPSAKRATPKRYRAYDESHRAMIETAVQLISEKGVEAVSVASVARELGIDRTTVYYHFANRDELLHAVSHWATEQLAVGMDLGNSQFDRIEAINRFVLDNPALIKLWIDDFVSGADIRTSYGPWDALVAGMRTSFDAQGTPDADAEAFSAMLLSAAIVGLRVFAKSLGPETPQEVIVARFTKEMQRLLRLAGLSD